MKKAIYTPPLSEQQWPIWISSIEKQKYFACELAHNMLYCLRAYPIGIYGCGVLEVDPNT